MEYRMLCETCGQIFCYTDDDINKSKTANVMGAISAIGSLAGVAGGNWMAARVNQAEMHNSETKVMDFNHCPNCHSTSIHQIGDAEWEGIKRDQSNAMAKASVSINANATVESLMKRIEIFLGDGEWGKAEAYCEQALDMDPENGTLYYYKLLATHMSIKPAEIIKDENLCESNDFKLARRYGGEELQEILDGLETGVRNYKVVEAQRRQEILKKEVENQLREEYTKCLTIIEKKDSSPSEIKAAREQLKTLGNYNDSEELIKKANQRLDHIKKNNKVIVILVIAVVCITTAIILVKNKIDKEKAIKAQQAAEVKLTEEKISRYETAKEKFINKDYEGALRLFNLGTKGNKNEKYKAACEILTSGIMEGDFGCDIGSAYSFYNNLSDENDEDEILIRESLSECKYIKLYENLLGKYESKTSTLAFYEDGTVHQGSIKCRLFSDGDKAFIATNTDSGSHRSYIHDLDFYTEKKRDSVYTTSEIKESYGSFIKEGDIVKTLYDRVNE